MEFLYGGPYMHRSVISYQLSLNICHILMLMLGWLSLLCRISYHTISYHISYHIIAPTLAPNPTHPCCMPPIYRKPSPKRGKSALKKTLTNIYIKSTNIVKTPGEIITNCTGCMWYHRPRTCYWPWNSLLCYTCSSIYWKDPLCIYTYLWYVPTYGVKALRCWTSNGAYATTTMSTIHDVHSAKLD